MLVQSVIAVSTLHNNTHTRVCHSAESGCFIVVLFREVLWEVYREDAICTQVVPSGGQISHLSIVIYL